MLLRLLVIVSLLAAITPVMAAAPRFGFQPPEVAAPVVNNGGIVEDAPPAAASPAGTATPASVAPAQAKSEQTNPAPGSTPTKTTAKPNSAEPKEEKRGFFWMFNRKKQEEEPVHKSEAALVPTEHYHKSVNEKLNSAELYEYRAGYYSPWRGDASKIMCSIQQQIPNYGYVEFRQGVGQPLQFALYVNHPPAGVGKVRVRIQPPHWRHYVQDKDLGELELEAGKRAMTMEANWSNRLLLELREGMQPVIHYWDAADATSDIEILLSALNFQESLNLFHSCLGQLINYDVQQAKHTVLYFNEDSSKLRKETTDKLDEIIEILKKDAAVKQVDLELYSTSEGLANYNFRLSTRRARAVRDYLVKKGIDEKRILIKIHTKTSGELKKLGMNESDVHIALKREGEK